LVPGGELHGIRLGVVAADYIERVPPPDRLVFRRTDASPALLTALVRGVANP
jgi:hypothetical protein